MISPTPWSRNQVGGLFVLRDAEGREIFDFGYADDAHREANVALVLAAPALFEALLQARPWIYGVSISVASFPGISGPAHMDFLDRALNALLIKIDNAIRAARGNVT